VLEHLFVRPIVSVNEVKDLIGTIFPAANTLVEKFVEIGILEKITEQARNRKFRYGPYARQFYEEY